jgi:hypothetical protein
MSIEKLIFNLLSVDNWPRLPLWYIILEMNFSVFGGIGDAYW